MRIALLAVLCALPQDETSRAIDRLGSDDVVERDQAARTLERLGGAGAERLERAAAQAEDSEVRGRLLQIARTIRKREAFAKVFGETRRATLEARGRPLGDVAAELGRALGETIRLENLDAARPVDLSLRDATLWQAIDALGRAAGARADYEAQATVLRPGGPPPAAPLYIRQFRVAVTEAQRFDHRGPQGPGSVLMFTVEVGYQRNMKPISRHSGERIRIASVTDAKGNDASSDNPSWCTSWSTTGTPFGGVQGFFARGDAALPLVIAGSTSVAFAGETKEIRLPLDGASAPAVEESCILRIAGFTSGAGATHVTLEARAPGTHEDLRNLLLSDSVRILDAAGGLHPVRGRGGGGGGGAWKWEFECRERIESPKALVFGWVSRVHWEEIPFRFEAVPFPGP